MIIQHRNPHILDSEVSPERLMWYTSCYKTMGNNFVMAGTFRRAITAIISVLVAAGFGVSRENKTYGHKQTEVWLLGGQLRFAWKILPESRLQRAIAELTPEKQQRRLTSHERRALQKLGLRGRRLAFMIN